MRADHSAVLDYPLSDYVMDGACRALLSMMEIQFAAGAKQVFPLHEMAAPYTSWAQARAAVLALPMKPRLLKMVSAHVMGGCGMAGTEAQGVTRPMACIGSWKICRFMTVRCFRPASAQIRSCRCMAR